MQAGGSDEERRICPDDGKIYSFPELMQAFGSEYTAEDLAAYWHDAMEHSPEQAVRHYLDRTGPGKDRPRALVVGGTYFLGIYVVRALLGAGFHVTILNRGSAGDAATRQKLEAEGVAHLRGDRNHSELWQALFTYVHFAVVVDMIMYHPSQLEIFLNAAWSPAGWRFGHYIFISSLSQYEVFEDHQGLLHGQGTEAPVHESDFEEQPSDVGWRAAREYARNKYGVHSALRREFQSRALPFTTLMIPAMSGPAARDAGQPDTRHWACQLLAASRQPWHLHEALRTRRHRVTAHPQHLADAVLAALRMRAGALGEAFHVAMAESLTLEEYLIACMRALGIAHGPQDCRYSHSPEAWMGNLFGREAARNWGPVSIDKARQVLGWSPLPLEDWLPETIRWWDGPGAAQLRVPRGLPSNVLAWLQSRGGSPTSLTHGPPIRPLLTGLASHVADCPQASAQCQRSSGISLSREQYEKVD